MTKEFSQAIFFPLFLLNKIPESIVQTLSRKVAIKKCTFTFNISVHSLFFLNKNRTNYSITCLNLIILEKTGRYSTVFSGRKNRPVLIIQIYHEKLPSDIELLSFGYRHFVSASKEAFSVSSTSGTMCHPSPLCAPWRDTGG